MRRTTTQLAWLMAALSCLLAAATASLAGNGLQTHLPMGVVKNRSGLRLLIDGQGIDANGYRPVKITVTTVPPKPLTADRQIRIVLKPNAYSGVNAPRVSQVIDLPEGSTSTTVTISLPQTSMWHGMTLDTYEGGQVWEELSQRHLAWSRTNYWDWSEARPAMLFIDADVPPSPGRYVAGANYRSTGADPTPSHNLPDIRTVVWLFPDPNAAAGAPQPAGTQAPLPTGPKATDVMLLAQVNDLPRIEMMAPADLPERWIDVSQYDVAFISLADLQGMATQQPRQLAALRDWLATGPLLVVYGVGDKFEELAAVEKLLALEPLAPDSLATSDSDNDRAAGPANWTVPEHKYKTSDLLTPFSIQYSTGRPARNPRTFKALKKARPQPKDDDPGDAAATITPAGPPPFVFRPAGMGCVAAIAAEQPFPGKDTDWIWLFNAIPDNHWRWFRRQGFSLTRENHDYWKFLIPGVGEAPVVSFLLLVSLFAVVIGPVNYILLGRARRLYLLLLTVPLGAAVVTLCLVVYALFTDGLGVRLRARSFVNLDQRTGRAASWARQSYYAAITPSQGLKFAGDTTVFPIVAQPVARGDQMVSGTLVWDDGQNLRSGFLASRTATQFMLQRATTSTAKLLVREGTASGEPPRVENKLGTDAVYLLLRDSRGDYFAGERQAAGAEFTLSATNPAAAEAKFKSLWESVEPKTPERFKTEIDRNNAFTYLMWRNYASYGSGQDAAAGEPLMDSGLLEANLADARFPSKNPLPPGSYVAIVNSSIIIPAGVPRPREEASLHVIRGRY